MKRRFAPYLPAAGIFFLALAVRIVFNLTVARGYILTYDAYDYNNIAVHLLNQHCFCMTPPTPIYFRAPLWPFLLAIIYAISGINNLHARIFLCFLDSGTCVLTYLLARDVFNKRIAVIAGIIAALYPGLFIYDGWLYAEAVYTFCVMGFAYSLLRLQHNFKVGWVISCGLFLACASLTRPKGVSLLAIVLIWALCMLRIRAITWRKAVQTIVVITCLTLALIAPWTLRNYINSHQFTLVATGGGLVLAGSYNDAALNPTTAGYPGLWVPSSKIRPPLTDFSDKAETAYAVHWIKTHFSEVPYLLSQHFINMWRPYTPEDGMPVREFPNRLSSQVVWALMNITPIAIIFLAACGLVLTIRPRWKELLIVYLVIGLTIVLCVAFYGSSRFRAPIEPLLVLLTGGAIWWLSAAEPGTLRSLLKNKERTDRDKRTSEVARI